jgi:hypothetical protein
VTAVAERPNLSPTTRVAIIEDNDSTARSMRLMLGRVLTPVRVDIRSNMDDMLAEVAAGFDCAVFDHRLGGSPGAAVNYTGAKAAYYCEVPSILISTYLDDDTTAIRQYQAKIPRVLNRLDSAGKPEMVRDALADATAEKAGHVRPDRVPYRTIVRVVEVQPAAVPRARVVVTAWRPDEPVSLPAGMISEATGRSLAGLTGQRFVADVNIYAASGTDLFFGNFSEATDLPPEWMPANG